MGRDYGVAILGEGVCEHIPAEDLAGMDSVERDAHGNIRFAEIQLGLLLKTEVRKRLKEMGVSATIVEKNIGYELRCAPPVAFDMEYTQDLGFAAARYLLEGNSGAMICVIEGKLVPLRFEDILDPKTGKTRIRRVDPDSDFFRVAQNYSIRLRASDFDDLTELARLALVANLTPEAFKERFGYLAL